MESTPVGEDGTPPKAVIQTTVALDGDGTDIAQARRFAAGFLTRVQAEHGLPISQRVLDLTQLVVSELVTNARKYAPGPVLLDLRIVGELVEIVVWDSDPALPIAGPRMSGGSASTVWKSSWLSPGASKSSANRSASASPSASLWPTPSTAGPRCRALPG